MEAPRCGATGGAAGFDLAAVLADVNGEGSGEKGNSEPSVEADRIGAGSRIGPRLAFGVWSLVVF
jgi:hypothetical protein